MPEKIGSIDFIYENSKVKIVANRNLPQIKLAGLTIGPFDEGNEYEIHYWIAKELAQEGTVHFREEDQLDSTKLYKIQWKEGVQIPGQITELQDDFYPKLRRFVKDTEELAKADNSIETRQEYERSKYIAQDIINSRLKKIISLASAPTKSDQVRNKLTDEEKILYEQLWKLVNQWRARIRQMETEK